MVFGVWCVVCVVCVAESLCAPAPCRFSTGMLAAVHVGCHYQHDATDIDWGPRAHWVSLSGSTCVWKRGRGGGDGSGALEVGKRKAAGVWPNLEPRRRALGGGVARSFKALRESAPAVTVSFLSLLSLFFTVSFLSLLSLFFTVSFLYCLFSFFPVSFLSFLSFFPPKPAPSIGHHAASTIVVSG